MKNIVILISGRGSNMEALIAARDAGTLPVNIAAVISNRPDATGLETAARAGITTHYIDHKAFAERDRFDAALAECIDGFAPDLVVLAGFMRILSDGFVRHYAGRLMNIHPSLLPAFPGLHTHRKALDEVLVIASALSVQDVRDRPMEAQQQADQAHAKFDDDKSEFSGYLKLWKNDG